MGLFEKFPFTNLHELNLDWLLNTVKKSENLLETVKEDFNQWADDNNLEDVIIEQVAKEHVRKYIMIGDSNCVDAGYNSNYTAMSKAQEVLTTNGWTVLETVPKGGASFSQGDATLNYTNMIQSLSESVKNECTDLVVFGGGNDANLTHTNYQLFVSYVRNFLLYALNASYFPKLERLIFIHHAVLTGIAGRYIRGKNNYMSGILDAYSKLNSVDIPNRKERVQVIVESVSNFAQNWTENINEDGFHYNRDGQVRMTRPVLQILTSGTVPNYGENSITINYNIENTYRNGTDEKIANMFDSIKLSYFPDGHVEGYVSAFNTVNITGWFEFDIPTNTIGYPIQGYGYSLGRCVLRDSNNIANTSDVGFCIVKRDKQYTRIRVFAYPITLSSAGAGKLLLNIPACY